MNQLASGEGFSRQGFPLSSLPSFTWTHQSFSVSISESYKQPVFTWMQISFLSSSSAPICSSCSSCSSSAQDDSSPCSLDELDVSVLFSFFGCGLQDIIIHIPIMDFTLQASLTGYSEVLVEVFYCRLPQKPPVSLLKWLWCENALSVLKRFFSFFWVCVKILFLFLQASDKSIWQNLFFTHIFWRQPWAAV